MNPLSLLVCLLSLLPAAVTALKAQAAASQTSSLAAERRELAEIRLLLQVERDYAGAKQRLAKLAESLSQRAEADAKDLAAEVERVRLDVARALGESVTPASGQDAVDRAVHDALARGDRAFISQLGRRAVPGLVQAVRANPDVFPSDEDMDPLVILPRVDVLAADRLTRELLQQEGFFWTKRVTRMLETAFRNSAALWSDGTPGEWLGDGLSATAEKLVEDPDVGVQALEFLLKLAKRGWRSETFDAALERAVRSSDSKRRSLMLNAIADKAELAGRARLEAWLGEEDARLRAFAIGNLAAAYPESTLPFAYLADPNPSVRQAVVAWLRRSRSERWTAAELDALVRLMRDASKPVSDAAWTAFGELPTVQYAPPIQDAHLAALRLGTRLLLVDPLPEAALQELLESEKRPERRLVLAQNAPRLPAALAFRVLAVLAADHDQSVLRAVLNGLQPILAAEDPAGFLRVAAVLLENDALPERRSVQGLVRWHTKNLDGLRVTLPWVLARRDEALFRDVFGDEPFPAELLIRAQPADVVEFVAQAWDLARDRARDVCNEDLDWTRELSDAFRPLARDADRPIGLRVLALKAALIRGSADEDAVAIARSLLSASWPDGDELESAAGGYVALVVKLPDAPGNALIAEALRDPALPELLATWSVKAMSEGERGASEIIRLVIERGFGKPAWRDAVKEALEAMGRVPALQDPEILARAARDPLHGGPALQAIGNLRDPRYLPLLADIVEHPDSTWVRDRAVEALFCFLDAEAVEPMLAAAARVTDPTTRDLCLKHLERIREYQDAKERWATRKVKAQTREQVIAELVVQLDAKSDEIKVQAIRALATWEAVEVMPRLIQLTASGSKSVATAAREALARLNQPPAEARKE